jgi:hypothetical protein
MRLLTSSLQRGAFDRAEGKITMTLLYSHHDRLHGSAGTGHHPIMRTLKRVRRALRTLPGRSPPPSFAASAMS